MSQNTDKLLPKFLIAPNRKTRLSVQIPQKLSDLIDEYIEFHKTNSGEEVPKDSLISAFISSAITSDKNFAKWKINKNKMQSNDVVS